MNDDQHDQVLFAQFGTSSPCWRLSNDSNALELTPVTGDVPANVAIPLNPQQASQIRCLTGITSHLVLDVRLFGEPLRLHLVGKKIASNTWAGTASAYDDTESVARDLVHGLSLSPNRSSPKSIRSWSSSTGMVVYSASTVSPKNSPASRKRDIVGRNVWALFMSTEAGAASSQNIAGFFNRGVSYEVERRVKTLHGERLFLFRNKFVQSGSGVEEQFLICSGTDITEERLAQERLTELANTDSLTGLTNRNAIQDKIRAAIEDGGAGRIGRRAVPRSRQLQEGQRPLRPRIRRPADPRRVGGHQHLPERRRYARAPRRRRIHRARAPKAPRTNSKPPRSAFSIACARRSRSGSSRSTRAARSASRGIRNMATASNR